MTTPQFIQIDQEDPDAMKVELADGLLAMAASVAPKYFYDALGSRLFEAITALPEYYPTRTEAGIFDAHAADMAAALPGGWPLVDLGAGNCAKAARLLGVLRPSRYVAVDISAAFLQDALGQLQRQHPALTMVGVGMDFSHHLVLPPEAGDGPRLVFYPGSSIGNFTPAQAVDFLRQIRQAAQGGALLIGVDLVKPASLLVPAYDDALGVTAAFNRNMLLHLNQRLGSDFQVAQWQHHALFNTEASRIEMHLQATQDLTVRWSGAERHFSAGERIHTENAYKYTPTQFEGLLHEAGFSSTQHWCDAQSHFAVFLALD
jgi:L-histidine N-alpha-methyltransferase